MGIWITEIDYSPLYRAIGGRQTAETLEERRKSRIGDAVVGVAQAAIDLGNIVYNQARETGLANLKLDLQKSQQEAEQQQRDIVLNKTYDYEQTTESDRPDFTGVSPETAEQSDQPANYTTTKTIKMPEEYEQWFKAKQKEIQEKYKAFPDLVSWGLDQLYSDYAETKRRVLNGINDQNVADQAKAENALLTAALDESITQGDPSYYEAALRSAKSLTPEARPAVEAEMKRQFEYGVSRKDVVATTQKDGEAAGLAAVQKLEDAKTLTAEQANEMRDAVKVAATDSETLYLGKARTEFTRMLQVEGASPEFALANAGNGTPVAYRAQVDRLLRAAYEEDKRQQDYAADAEMLEWHGANPLNGIGLWNKLHNPEAQYNRRMSTSTYTFWERMATGLMDNGGADDSDETTPEALDKLNDIIKDPYLTPEVRKQKIRDLDATETIGFSTYTKYLGYADDANFQVASVQTALGRIDEYFKKDAGSKGENPSLARQQAIDAFSQGLQAAGAAASKRGQRLDDETIDRLATDVMKPGKPQQPKIDQVPSNARNTEAARMITRALTKKGALLTDAESVGLATFSTEKLKYHYGLTDDQIREGYRTEDGIPTFWTRGLNPANPEQEIKVAYFTDEKGNLYPAMADTPSTWIRLPTETVQDRDKRLKDEETAAERAEQYRFAAAATEAGGTLAKPKPATTTAPAVPAGGTVESIRSLAQASKTTPEAIVQQSADKGGLSMPERADLQEKLDSIKGTVVSSADVTRLARELKQRVDFVWAAILDLGYTVGN